MNKLLTRSLSGIVYVALIVGCALGGYHTFTLLMTLFMAVGMLELNKMLSKGEPTNFLAIALDIAFALWLLAMPQLYGIELDVLAYLPLRIIIAVVTSKGNQTDAFARSIFSISYLALPLMCLISIYNTDAFTALSLFILIWINDTGAFLSGCTLGRHKLCERLSPKKTWEGFWGGFIFTVAAAVGLHFLGWIHLSITYSAVLGAIVSIVGTFGDLFESMIKRNAGVKDSGNLIPGHGGILDRIDSLLAVSPIVLLII